MPFFTVIRYLSLAFVNVPADVGTHIFQYCFCVSNIFQQIGVTCCLLVAFPIERKPVSDSIMEILQEMRIGFKLV